MKQPKRMTRRERQMQELAIPAPRITPRPVPRLEPKNPRQREALAYLQEGRPVVFLTGSAGTGKTLLAAYRAASQFTTKAVRKIYLVRPAVAVGKTIGLLPGELEDKMTPFLAQMLEHLKKFMGAGPLEHAIKAGDIEMKPVEYMRGMSFEDCIVLLDEAQNLTSEEMLMILTRVGQNCQLVITGDSRQNDLKTESGIISSVRMIERLLQTHPQWLDKEDIDALDGSVGVVNFLPEDVVRSGFTKAIVKAMYYS